MSLPVILDTDLGNDPDDLLALAMVLDRNDLFDLKAVITTGKDPNLRANFVQHLCKLSSRNIPIGIGRPTLLSNEPSRIHSHFFCESEADLSPSNTFPEAQDILKDIWTPEVTLITIGPLSTLANFIIKNPSRVKDKNLQVVSMGGFISRKKKDKYVKEYNFGSDTNATRIVLRENFRHICVTKNICAGILMLPEDCSIFEPVRSPARKYAFAFMSEWFKEKKEKKLHDPLTVTAAIEINKLTVEKVEFNIDNDGGCKGSIINHGQRYATIGSTPRYLDWFFEIFYGDSK